MTVNRTKMVIGAGAWGSAIANLLASNAVSGEEVVLDSSFQNTVDEFKQKRTNERSLPGIILEERLTIEKDVLDNFPIEELAKLKFVFVATTSSEAPEIFQKIADAKEKGAFTRDCAFILCSKGFCKMSEKEGLSFVSDAFEKITGIKNYAVLAGPTFAIEVAAKMPTVTTIASVNEELAKKIADVLINDRFSVSISESPLNAEICSIVKNIMAIGCGIIDGLELGINTKAALIVKGCNEIQQLCRYYKTSDDLENPHGFGDIYLTCSSEKSRNYSLGKLLAKEKSYAEIVKETGKTYEGFSSARDLAVVTSKTELSLPLCFAVNDILSNKLPRTEITQKLIAAIL